MTVLFIPEVRQYFRQLEDTLYEKEYFGFEETAIQYVRELETNLPVSAKRIKRRLILTGTEKICFIPVSGKTNVHNGTYSLMFTELMAKQSIWYGISATIMS